MGCGAWEREATPQAQFYEAYLLHNLIETVQALRSGHWRPRRPVCFMVDKPKAREIHAAHYSDRVVHHWLVPGLEALYEPVFIHDVYSNRKDKGTHMAVKRLQHFMRGVSRWREDAPVGTSWFPCVAWERRATRDFQIKNPCLVVSKVIVRQQGYLKGGLRRRCIESITLPPFSQTGVLLCGQVSP